ncbi:hypothetical protein H5410_058645 [Solanum commersonii]|uniref:Uncharacterized protein n=1 Tax=Solanum commersonii TaxID=4109 RepID=A0A9J5WTA2_SOLCO|nr:hypothetical protein H5410_058645 [Solanum commersonii]
MGKKSGKFKKKENNSSKKSKSDFYNEDDDMMNDAIDIQEYICKNGSFWREIYFFEFMDGGRALEQRMS